MITMQRQARGLCSLAARGLRKEMTDGPNDGANTRPNCGLVEATNLERPPKWYNNWSDDRQAGCSYDEASRRQRGFSPCSGILRNTLQSTHEHAHTGVCSVIHNLVKQVLFYQLRRHVICMNLAGQISISSTLRMLLTKILKSCFLLYF